ncbi:MAG: hypothetical protein F6K28_58430, partial [Microcoleus sp. SIO2G3]|nr:hypothetical protein [Microcoleus sp. SIO2G3]
MFSSASLSKTVAQASLVMGAIAGSLLAVSFHPVSASTQIQTLSTQTSAPTEINREAVLAIALG